MKCYGGLLHGQTVNTELTRFESRKMAPKLIFRNDSQWYTVVRYTEDERGSHRYRELTVAIVDCGPLTIRDQEDLDHDIEQKPWEEITRSSILDDFEQWL